MSDGKTHLSDEELEVVRETPNFREDFLREVERRAGASREEMLASGVTREMLRHWLRAILGGKP